MRRRWNIVAFFAALLAHGPSVRCEFTNWDDTAYLHNNRLIRSQDGLRQTWTTTQTPQYYPLTFTSFWIEHRLWGLSPTGYHVTNVVLHAVNAALLAGLLASLGLSPAAAGLAAVLFAVSPVQVMSVAWVAERKNVLSTLFGLLSLLAAGRWLRGASAAPGVSSLATTGAEPRRGSILFSAALLAFAAALLAKSAWLVLPLVVAAAARWCWQVTWGRTLAIVAPQLVLSAVSAIVTSRIETREFADALIPPLRERLLIVPGALLHYVRSAVLPFGLAPFYPRWELAPASAAVWGSLVALSLSAGALLWNRRRLPPAAAWGLLTFIIFLVPIIGLLPYGNLSVTWVSDHYLYVACAGLYAALVTLLSSWAARRPDRRRPLRAMAALAVLGGVVGCWRQIPIWHDDLTLWQHVVSRTPDVLVGRWGRAKAWLVRGEREKAGDDYRRLLELRPDLAEARGEYGKLLIGLGRFDEAAIELQAALGGHSAPGEVLADLGVALERGGHVDAAIDALRRALAAKPDHLTGYARLGELLARQGRFAESVEALRAGLRVAGDAGSWRLADSLSRILATATDPAVRDPVEAVTLARRNCAPPSGESPESLETLAIALRSAGHAAEARQAASRALALLRARSALPGDAALAERLQRLLRSVGGA